MYNVSPKEVERYHLRILLLHVAGAISFEDLRTVDGVTYHTFKEACLAMGLIADDAEYHRTMRDTIHYAKPRQCRRVFAYLLLFCGVSDAKGMWDSFKQSLSEDYVRSGHDEEEAEHLALVQIDRLLRRNGSNTVLYELPDVAADSMAEEPDETSFTASEVQTYLDSLNREQRAAADAICERLQNFSPSNCNVFAIDGPAGTGKTYLYNYILMFTSFNNIRTLSSAWVGIAATLLKNGKTCHATFKLPVPCILGSKCNVSPASEYAEELRSTTLFIVDEISQVSSYALDAIDLMLRDVCNNSFPFGGKIIVLGGDFRQTLPIVKNGTTSDILNASVVSSKLWSLCQRFTLSTNMRARKEEQYFAKFLLHLGCDRLALKPSNPYVNSVTVPQQCITSTSLKDEIFPPTLSVNDISSRVILTPTNKVSLRINDEILSRFPGDLCNLHSADSAILPSPDDEDAYPMDFLNSLTPTGLPPHNLSLKVDAIVMLLKNLDLKNGLTNGTRLRVRKIHKRVIEVEIITGFHSGKHHFLPKLVFEPSDSGLPFVLRRFQFPLRLAYCMTINKSQGQTFEKVGILLQKPCFSHGQLYVAFSRARAFNDIKVAVENYGNSQGKHLHFTYTKNVVMHAILEAAGTEYTTTILDTPHEVLSPARGKVTPTFASPC